jgi:hypothetical protein
MDMYVLLWRGTSVLGKLKLYVSLLAFHIGKQINDATGQIPGQLSRAFDSPEPWVGVGYGFLGELCGRDLLTLILYRT